MNSISLGLKLKAIFGFATRAYVDAVAGGVGVYRYQAFNSDDGDWYIVNGRALSRTLYPALYAKIGTDFGAGDGSTTFNLPPSPAGRALGVAGQGSFTSTFANSDVDATGNTIAVSANDSLYTGTAAVLSTSGAEPAGLTAGTTYYVIRVSSTSIKLATTRANAIAGTAIDITGQGTGNHTLTITYTDRAVGSLVGEETHGLTIAEMPSHTHTINDNYGVQDLEATFNNGNAADEITRDETTSATGGSTAHNIMQPTGFLGYLAIKVK